MAEITYIGEAAKLNETLYSASIGMNVIQDPKRNYLYELENIAQAHHFTIDIEAIKLSYDHPAFGKFLPVRSASFHYISFENMQIPMGIYGDLPIMKRRSVGRLNLQFYDNHKDEIEFQIKNWINRCFPGGKYVNYLSNMASVLTYTSFDVTGKRNQAYPLKVRVIPADSYSINRSYEENAAKIVDFSVIIVGDLGVSKSPAEPMKSRQVPTSTVSAKASGDLELSGHDDRTILSPLEPGTTRG